MAPILAIQRVEVDAYLKDLPIARVASDVLIAMKSTAQPLPPMARLSRPARGPRLLRHQQRQMAHADDAGGERANGRSPPLVQRWQSSTLPARKPPETSPVWSIAPESIIGFASPRRQHRRFCSDPLGAGVG